MSWGKAARAAAAARRRRGTAVAPALVAGCVAALALGPPSAFADGQLLVHAGNGAVNEAYSQFAAAAGRTAVTSSTLPSTDAQWDTYACVVLPVPTVAFTPAQQTALSSYMARGGTVVALAEHLNADQGQIIGPASVAVLNGLAAGTGIQAQSTTVSPGPATTTDVSGSVWTQGVAQVGYAATATLSVTAPAVTLLRTAQLTPADPAPTPFLALRQIGDGKFVYAGDSNLFSDGGGGAYAGKDNGRLANNLCGDINPPLISIASPADGARYRRDQAVTAAWTCSDPDGAVDASLTTATRQVGEAVDTTTSGAQTITRSFTVSCTDTAGNAATRTVTYTVDGNPPDPVISTPVDGGSYARGSTHPAAWTCVDPDGDADVRTRVGTVPAGTPINTAVKGVKSFTVTCADQAGNTAARTVTYTVPNAPPQITITTPADGARFRKDQVVSPAYACTDPDGASDIRSCARADGATGPLDTSTGGTRQFTINAEDQDGGTASRTVTYTVDASPPRITITAPADGARFRLGQFVAAGYACTNDAGPSDVTLCSGTIPNGLAINTSTPGTKSFTVTAQDQTGNTSSTTVHYEVDASPPQIAVDAPVDGGVYARNATLVADFACTDPSGPGDVVACTGTAADGAAVDTSTLGPATFTVLAEDRAGNTTSRTVQYTVVDLSAPQITISSPADGDVYARGARVAADYACTDDGGPAAVMTCAGPVADGAPITTAQIGPRTFTVVAEDTAGNRTTATVTYTVEDRVPPDIDVSVPADGGAYVRGAVVNADYSCSDDGGPESIATCTGPVGVGAPIDTGATGTRSFKVTASDRAGNTRSRVVTYTVVEPPEPGAAPPAAGPPGGQTAGVSVSGPAIGALTAARGGRIGLRLTIPSAGTLAVTATASTGGAARTHAFAKLRRAVQAGSVKLTLRPTRSARRLLARRKRLRVTIRAVFTPGAGGRPAVLTRKVTVRARG